MIFILQLVVVIQEKTVSSTSSDVVAASSSMISLELISCSVYKWKSSCWLSKPDVPQHSTPLLRSHPQCAVHYRILLEEFWFPEIVRMKKDEKTGLTCSSSLNRFCNTIDLLVGGSSMGWNGQPTPLCSFSSPKMMLFQYTWIDRFLSHLAYALLHQDMAFRPSQRSGTLFGNKPINNKVLQWIQTRSWTTSPCTIAEFASLGNNF